MAKQDGDNLITVKIDPVGRRVRLRELRNLIDNLAACLDRLSEITIDGAKPEFSISNLFAGSAGVQVAPDEARPKESAMVIERFKSTIRGLHEDKALASLDAKTLQLFRKLAMPASRRENRMWFDELSITTQFLANIDKRLDGSVRAFGHLKGVLERINVHGTNEFVVYPPINTTGIRCVFEVGLTDKVGAALKRSVTVSGLMTYRGDEPYPTLVEVEDLEVHPPDSELPTLDDLRGLAPECTGDLTSLEFIRSLQND